MKSHVLIFAIIALSLFLRLFNIAHVPPSPSLDEVSIGWNAYSISLTGKDEFQTGFPTVLRAYDDFRPAAYVYLVMPFVRVFGLTASAVRLPSILLSVASVVLVYGIATRIRTLYRLSPYIGEIAAFLLAISPWHIYISRLGHEANLGLTLFMVGLFALVQFVTSKKGSWLVSASGAFALSLWGYQSEKIVSPLFVLVFVLLYGSLLKKKTSYVLAAVFIGVVLSIHPFMSTISSEGLSRYRGTTAFSPYSDTMRAFTSRYVTAQKNRDIVGRIQNSKYAAYTVIFTQNYLSHFAPGWLFWGSSREAHKVPGMGLLYWWEAIALVFGLWSMLKKERTVMSWLLLSGVFISPIPAAITTQSPHAMRSFTALPFLVLIEAIGFLYIASLRFSYKRLIAVIACGILATSLASFWKGYFIRFPIEQSDSFQFSTRPAFSYARAHESEYARISVSHQHALYQSYMFYLFYSGYDPRAYASLGGTISGGYDASHVIGKYSFGYLPQTVPELSKDVLYLYDINDVPSGAEIIERFADNNGTISIVAVISPVKEQGK